MASYILLYYAREDQQEFRRAAETMRRDIEARKSFDSKCDRVILKSARTARDFVEAWYAAKEETDGDDPNLKVKEVRIFSHGGPGLIYMLGDGLISQQVASLGKLNWMSKGGSVICHSFKSGLNDPKKLSIAGAFEQGQGVPAYGQDGFSTFSTSPYLRIPVGWATGVTGNSVSVYLWAYGTGEHGQVGPARPPIRGIPPPPWPCAGGCHGK
jgi:hypothetical protein